MTLSERERRLQSAMDLSADLFAAISLFLQNPTHENERQMQSIFVDLGNDIGCTAKPDKPHLVQVQRTERDIIRAFEKHEKHIRAEAANAVHLRRKCAELTEENVQLQADRDRIQAWANALESSETNAVEEAANLRLILDRQVSARSREAA